jgi:6-pyruvoyl-tetrahydropterin synthase
MKTLTIELFKFNELTDDVKAEIIEKYRDKASFNEYRASYNEFNNSKKAFLNVFGLNEIGYSICYINLPSEVDKLTGIRLATYIWNNYSQHLEKKRVNYHKSKSKFSNIYKDRSCALTGYIYDDYFTQGIWSFLKTPCPNTTLADLIKSCVKKADSKREDDVDNAYYNDTLIIENLEKLDCDYLADGEEFTYNYTYQTV